MNLQTEVRNSETGIGPEELAQSIQNQKVIIINLSNQLALGEALEKSQSKSYERVMESKLYPNTYVPTRQELPKKTLLSFEDFEYEDQIDLQVEGL